MGDGHRWTNNKMPTPLTWDNPALHWDDPNLRWDGFIPDNSNNTMASNNLVSAALTAADVTAINAAIATLRDKLPFLIELTKQERRRLAHAGDGSQGFVQNSLTFAAQHPEALPGLFDAAEYAKDGALAQSFKPIAAAIAQLNEEVQDTELALDHDLMVESLDVYAFAKANNRNGSYDSYIEAAKVRFARSPRKKATTPPTPTP